MENGLKLPWKLVCDPATDRVVMIEDCTGTAVLHTHGREDVLTKAYAEIIVAAMNTTWSRT